MELWIARDRSDTGGLLNLFPCKPKTSASGVWYSFPNKDFITLEDDYDFPEIIFDNSPQKVKLEVLETDVLLRKLSLNRIIEGRMDVVDILISLLTYLDEERIVELRRCIVEIQKRGYANFDDIRLMSNCGIPIYKQYIEDKKIKEHITESFTMDFELCKKYITEFVIGLSVDVIKRIDFDYGYTRSEVIKI